MILLNGMEMGALKIAHLNQIGNALEIQIKQVDADEYARMAEETDLKNVMMETVFQMMDVRKIAL